MIAEATVEAEPDETPEACQSRWSQEMSAARKHVQKWHEQARKVMRRLRDQDRSKESESKRLNLFWADVQQVESMLFAQTPDIDVRRRFADAHDAMARVSAELLGRVLSEDLRHSGESQKLAMQQALSDRIRIALGNARVRYDVDFEQRPTGALDETGEPILEEVKSREEAEVVYLHWRDQLWDPEAHVFSECRWWAFRALMGRKELVRRFGKEVGGRVELNAKKVGQDGQPVSDEGAKPQAEIWEVWSKDDKEVYWYAEGAPAILDRQPPPIDLEGFWPFPRPMFGNLTTDELIPVPDFVMAQDQYDELDEMVTRRAELVDSLKVAGVYDQACGPLSRVLTEAKNGELIPVPNWGAFSEKGGLAGAIAFVPIGEVASAVDKISEQIEVRKSELYEVTGRSDIMRGQQVQNGTPGEAQLKTQFASARLNAMSEDFARFVSDLQRLRAEVMAKYFSPETLLQRSNAQYTYDAEMSAQAVQLIQSDVRAYRICIKSDSLGMADYGARRQEASEVLGALGGFVQQAGQVAQVVPGSMPFLLELLRWAVAGLKGGQEIGGLLDKAIQAAQQPQPQQGPQQSDPKVQAAQIQSQGKAQELQLKSQLDAQHMQLETQQLRQRQQDQVAANVTETLAAQRIKQGGSPAGIVPGVGP